MDQWKVTIWSDETGAFPLSPKFATYEDAVAYVEEEQAWDAKNGDIDFSYSIEEIV